MYKKKKLKKSKAVDWITGLLIVCILVSIGFELYADGETNGYNDGLKAEQIVLNQERVIKNDQESKLYQEIDDYRSILKKHHIQDLHPNDFLYISGATMENGQCIGFSNDVYTNVPCNGTGVIGVSPILGGK